MVQIVNLHLYFEEVVKAIMTAERRSTTETQSMSKMMEDMKEINVQMVKDMLNLEAPLMEGVSIVIGI